MQLPMLPPPRSSEENTPIQAVEFEAVISPGRHVTLPQGQSLKSSSTPVARTVTVRVSHRTVHVLLDGQLIRTRSMAFADADLQRLIMRGGRPGGPEPQGDISADKPLAPATVVEVEVEVEASKDGMVSLGEALRWEDADIWQRAAPGSVMVENLYGPTELTITVSAHRWSAERTPAPAVNGVVPIGAVHDGHRHLLLGGRRGGAADRG